MMRLVLITVSLVASLAAQTEADRVSEDLDKIISRAIERGIGYLKSVQREDGSWIYESAFAPWGGRGPWQGRHDSTAGLTALALYGMAVSGADATDPAVASGLAWCKAQESAFLDGRRATYSASLLILALTRIDAAKHKKWIHRLAKRIIDSQLTTGMWSYEMPGKDAKKRTPSPLEAWNKQGDNSNTQFAVMALWSAQTRASFRVPARTWRSIKSHYERTRREDGGWSYRVSPARKPPKGAPGFGRMMPMWMNKAKATMTAGALVSLACAMSGSKGKRGLTKSRRSKLLRGELDAFRSSRKDWPRMFQDLYFAYSVERVGATFDLPLSEWYEPGARTLVDRQRADGRWSGSWRRTGAGAYGDRNQVYETSFALAFLSRATGQ